MTNKIVAFHVLPSLKKHKIYPLRYTNAFISFFPLSVLYHKGSLSYLRWLQRHTKDSLSSSSPLIRSLN